jgi:hypothetical protein
MHQQFAIMKTHENEVNEIIEVVIKLTWGYTIFCALFQKKDADREARGAHPEFFMTMYDSLFCGFCVTTALLFNDKPKATSICNLIKDIEALQPELAEKLNEKIRVNRSVIDKIETIRHQVCAHRWEKKTPQEVFEEVQPRLNMVKNVIDLARFIVFELADVRRKEELERQQLSEHTLQCITYDAGLVMRAFGETA